MRSEVMNENEFFETVCERMLPELCEDLHNITFALDFDEGQSFEKNIDFEGLKRDHWSAMKSTAKKALLDFDRDTKNGTRHAYGYGEADISKEDFKAIVESEDCSYLCDIYSKLFDYLEIHLKYYLKD